MNKKIIFTTLGALLLSAQPINSFARDFLRFAGSSTVFPYVSAASENWSKSTNKKSPIVETLGTGGGFKNFCMGMGDNSADVAMASRKIIAEEQAACKAAGVNNIIELMIGYDGIVVAQAKTAAAMTLSRADLFQALAGDDKGKNPKKNWQEVNGKFASREIKVYGPGASSGTRDSLIELALSPGAKKLNPKADKDAIKKMASSLRRDGGFIDSGENDNVIVNKIKSDKMALGIFGYDYLLTNKDSLVGVAVEGILPTVDTIRNKTYPLSRPLFLYVKADALKNNPDLKNFLTFFMSDSNIGDNGKMVSLGLVPLKTAERTASVAKIK